MLEVAECERARVARDRHYDGRFFTGVRTTRIYCRPVCTARTPGRDRCRFFPNPALAEREGFRPCLRCRPELAPGQAPVDAVGRTARRAAARIEAGALNDGGNLAQLATELGLSARQLRRSIRQEFGVSPVELAQTKRLLLARQLLAESDLPMIDVVLASGFSSLRRFNALFLNHYRFPPSQIRRVRRGGPAVDSIRLSVVVRDLALRHQRKLDRPAWRKYSLQPVVVLVGDRVVFMVVAARTTERQTEKHLAGGIGHVVEDFLAAQLQVSGVEFIGEVAIESSGHQGFGIARI